MCYKLIDEIGLEKFMAKVKDGISSGWILIEGQFCAYYVSDLGDTRYTQMFKKLKK